MALMTECPSLGPSLGSDDGVNKLASENPLEGLGLGVASAANQLGLNTLQELILSCNKDGMESLRQVQAARHDPHLKAAFEQFKYAEAILLSNQMERDNTALLAVTCNNLGCYYKKVGKYHGALSYLRRALKMEMELETDEVTLASTHLNICTILSKLEKHDKAVQHALTALELMSKRVTQTEKCVSEDDYAVLAIAYHSVAMEREFFQQWDQAAMAFQAGFQVANRLLGEGHPLSLTLGKNCEAVMIKATNAKNAKAKDKSGQQRAVALDAEGADTGVALPAVPGALPKGMVDAPMTLDSAKKSVRNEANDWVKSEEALWLSFASRALGQAQESCDFLREDDNEQDRDHEHDHSTFGEEDPASPHASVSKGEGRKSLASIALNEMHQDVPPAMPKAYDMGAFRFQSLSPRMIIKKTRLGQVLDKHPEALMDIMDADNSTAESKVQDFRPNRTMKRQTRTSRVVRRTGVFNSMYHRDRVEQDLAKKRMVQSTKWKSMHVQRVAAQRIQQVLRLWFKYCQDNSEWMTITWISATMIQSTWRSYHVRRQHMDKHAVIIQRHIRGFLVWRVMRKHTAAVNIQRAVNGRLVRARLAKLHKNACKIQGFVRGCLARRDYNMIAAWVLRAVVVMQKHSRVFIAKRIYRQRADARGLARRQECSACDIQRLYRGYAGRLVWHSARHKRDMIRERHRAAVCIQTTIVRPMLAQREVARRREKQHEAMEHAVTFVRKIWLGNRTRKQLQIKRAHWRANMGYVLIVQRYMRGCLARLRIWNDVTTTQERLWAAVEIQRVWRGYCGRLTWERKYELNWRQELAAAVLQRNLRGWVVRLKVTRKRRAMARAEFERARDRFRAAVKIEKHIRGLLTRNRVALRRLRLSRAATQIQRIQRGRAVRVQLWHQVIEQRVTIITAMVRGFLVRRRQRHLVHKVRRIQRCWRKWRTYPELLRMNVKDKFRRRQVAAAEIQSSWRQTYERKVLIKLSDEAGRSGRGLC